MCVCVCVCVCVCLSTCVCIYSLWAALMPMLKTWVGVWIKIKEMLCAVIYCCVTALTMCFLCVCVCVRVCFVHVLSVLGLCMCVCVHVCLHACVSALIVCNYWFSVGPCLPASAP